MAFVIGAPLHSLDGPGVGPGNAIMLVATRLLDDSSVHSRTMDHCFQIQIEATSGSMPDELDLTWPQAPDAAPIVGWFFRNGDVYTYGWAHILIAPNTGPPAPWRIIATLNDGAQLNESYPFSVVWSTGLQDAKIYLVASHSNQQPIAKFRIGTIEPPRHEHSPRIVADPKSVDLVRCNA